MNTSGEEVAPERKSIAVAAETAGDLALILNIYIGGIYELL